MQEDSFQHNLTLIHTEERLSGCEKEKVKIQRRILKEKIEENKINRPSIRLNLKKLPKDWFTPRKSPEKSSSQQTIETERYQDTNPSNNPESHYSSEQLIGSDEFTDELQRTSHFGESLESPTMKKELDNDNECSFNNESREDGILGIESSPYLNDSNDEKFLISPTKKQFTIDLKNILSQERSQEFDLTFSNPINRGKSFSVKQVIKKPLQEKTEQIISEFHIEPKNTVLPRNVSERRVSLSKTKEALVNLNRKVRLLSKEQKHRLAPFSLQNTQEMKRTLTKPYFKKDEMKREPEEVFHKLNELHLPPIAKLKRN